MYKLNLVIVKPFTFSGAGTAQRYHQEKYFVFALTPQQVREVCISRYECGVFDADVFNMLIIFKY